MALSTLTHNVSRFKGKIVHVPERAWLRKRDFTGRHIDSRNHTGALDLPLNIQGNVIDAVFLVHSPDIASVVGKEDSCWGNIAELCQRAYVGLRI